MSDSIGFTDISDAIHQANQTLSAADRQTYQIACVLKGRLRQVNADGVYYKTELLKDLKKELSRFNARTGTWKD